MPIPSSSEAAAARPTTHRFEQGQGYVEFGPHEVLPPGPFIQTRCRPPKNTADGTLHTLKSGRGTLVDFMWREADRVWLALNLGRANRLGFTTTYLSSHGWTYSGPADSLKSKQGH